MIRSTRPSLRLAAVAVAACAALAVVVPVGPGVSAAPADIAIPLDSGQLTVNGFTMNWPDPSVTGAELVGTWDAETGALDAVLESTPVTLTYPQLTGGEGTVTMVAASFTGTVLPGQTGAVTGAVTVEVRSTGLLNVGGAAPAQPAESLCASEGEIAFTSTLIPVQGGFGLTLTATGFDFPLDSGFFPIPGSSEDCFVDFTEAATGTPTTATNLAINGFVATAPPAPTPPAPTPPAPTPPAPTPVVPAFTG